MSRRSRLVVALLAAAAFAAGGAAPSVAAPGGSQGSADTSSGSDYQALSDHKPAGTGSGRKIG